MTYLEKCKQENPKKDTNIIIRDDCPTNFGLEDRSPCSEMDSDCIRCWNREFPDEPQEQPTDTPTQPQILDSGNREEDTRKKILEDAIYCVCTDRKQQYGKPENSFSVIADFWSMYIRHKYAINIALTAADASMMLALFKVARGVTATTQKLDTYVDICGYAACAGELECKEEK